MRRSGYRPLVAGTPESENGHGTVAISDCRALEEASRLTLILIANRNPKALLDVA